MPKRKAAEEAEFALASKKLLLEGSDPFLGHPEDDGDYDDTTSQSTATAKAETAYTATTTVSNRSRKFPSDIKSIKCTYPDCDKTFNRPARLAAHLRSHTDDRPFKCTHEGCDKSYREEKHLRQHVKGSHTQERSYVCTTDGCGKSFLTATRLRRHQDVHTGAERFRCRDYPPCNQSFRKHNTLQRHIRSEHQGGHAYLCTHDGCTAGFDSQGALRNHLKRDHSEPLFWCDECSQEAGPDGEPQRVGFTTLLQLQTHIRKEHLSCIFCDQKCKGQFELEKHVEIHHSGVPVEARKTIACPWDGCDKKFTKKNNLNAHIRSAHEGHRFVCGEVDLSTTADLQAWSNASGCGTGFVTKANLEAHVRHIHLGMERAAPAGPPLQPAKSNILDDIAGANRTLACPNCPERFIRAADLQAHLANHPLTPVEAAVLRLASPPTEREMPDLPFLNATQTITYRTEPDEINWADDPDVFWVGAQDDPAFGGDAFQAQNDEETWRREERDMRALIDSGSATPDFSEFIDPALVRD